MISSEGKKIIITANEKGQRLDVFLAEKLNFSRTRIQSLIEDGKVLLEGKLKKANYRIRGCEKIEVEIPPSEHLEVLPEKIALDIIYEDRDILVINKPRGMVVHPACGVRKGTLVNAILYHCADLSGIGGIERPGIVHRLDRDTSGVLMVAKNDAAHLSLSEQISSRKVRKEYLALVHGKVSPKVAIVNAPIGRDPCDRKRMAVVSSGREALTKWEVVEYLGNYTLLKLYLFTGRTHQIRVHLASCGYSLVGDKTYSRRKNPFGLEGQFLHASCLGFKHPSSGDDMEFYAPLPPELKKILLDLGSVVEL